VHPNSISTHTIFSLIIPFQINFISIVVRNIKNYWQSRAWVFPLQLALGCAATVFFMVKFPPSLLFLFFFFLFLSFFSFFLVFPFFWLFIYWIIRYNFVSKYFQLRTGTEYGVVLHLWLLYPSTKKQQNWTKQKPRTRKRKRKPSTDLAKLCFFRLKLGLKLVFRAKIWLIFTLFEQNEWHKKISKYALTDLRYFRL
jgi:hypothetical protein